MSASKTLSKSGTLFFSSLCIGTFGLGCWQTQRYFEKITQVEQRKEELQMDPIPYQTQHNSSFRRYKIKGRFHHNNNVLIGPRGPPLDTLSKSGPMSGRAGGMGVSPQGYFIITPFECQDKHVVLVNRGWVPQHYIKQSIPYEQNNDTVEVIAVKSSPESPSFFIPKQSKKDNTLLWMEEEALRDATHLDDDLFELFVETDEEDKTSFPVKPSAESVGQFKVMPFTHATYAFTWFGLSTAGVIMTRKLITRGR